MIVVEMAASPSGGMVEDDQDVFTTEKKVESSSSSDEILPDTVLPPTGEITSLGNSRWGICLTCPSSIIGILVGKGRERVKTLMSEHPGCTIQIPRERTKVEELPKEFDEWIKLKMSKVQIVADKEDTCKAVAEQVKQRLASAMNKATYTHFLAIPFMDSPELKKSLEEFAEFAKSKKVADKSIISPDQMHMTILMLKIYDKDTLTKVQAALQAAMKRIGEQGLKKPITMHFVGAHKFSADRFRKSAHIFTHAGHQSEESMEVTSQEPEGKAARISKNEFNTLRRNIMAAQKLVQEMSRKVTDDTEKQTVETFVESCGNVEKLFSGMVSADAAPVTTKKKASVESMTVLGDEPQRVFLMFEIFLEELVRAKVLTTADLKDRRIVLDNGNKSEEDAEGKEGQTKEKEFDGNLIGRIGLNSLTLHLTLIRMPGQGANKIIRSLVDPKIDFGTCTSDQLNLYRRSIEPKTNRYQIEQEFSLK